MRWWLTAWLLAIILGIANVVVSCTRAAVPAHAQPQPLVYVCQQIPCQNGQELEVFDGYGNPGFSVGEYGGVGVFGDNLTLSGRTRTEGFHHFVTVSEQSPAGYDRLFRLPVSCTAPGVWLEPGGLWSCVSGRWVLKVRL